MNFPCVVFINSVALRIVIFWINVIFETLKRSKALWEFFCPSTDENSIPVISTLFCATSSLTCFLFSCWICSSTLLLMPSLQHDIFVRLTAQNVRQQGGTYISAQKAFYFPPMQSYTSPFLSYVPAQGRKNVEFLYIMPLQLKRHFHNMSLKECAIGLKQSMKDIWGYKDFWYSPTRPALWYKVSEALIRHCLDNLASHKKAMNHVLS